MRRGVLTVLATLLAAAGLLWPVVPALLPDTGDAPLDPVTISDYRADLRVDEDGTLHAVEELTARFPSGRHGIFRFWDVADAHDSSVRLFPDDIDVRMDSGPVPFELLWDHGTRYRVAKIGDPESLVSEGTHVYRVSYRIDGASRATSGETPSCGGTPSRADGRCRWTVRRCGSSFPPRPRTSSAPARSKPAAEAGGSR